MERLIYEPTPNRSFKSYIPIAIGILPLSLDRPKNADRQNQYDRVTDADIDWMRQQGMSEKEIAYWKNIQDTRQKEYNATLHNLGIKRKPVRR